MLFRALTFFFIKSKKNTMSKIIYLLSLLFFCQSLFSQSQILPCPISPNCVSTHHKKSGRQFEPLTYQHSLSQAKAAIKIIIQDKKNIQLVKEEETTLHYEYRTKFGGFIDDVLFYFDDQRKEIHFRSASRKGYHDMGANKRRMKKITKAWSAIGSKHLFDN